MGNWSEQQEVRKEVKEKDKVRREKLASLFFDLCKVTYTVLVVGLLVTLFQNELYTNYLMIALVVVGVLVAFIIRKSKFPQNPKRSVRFSGKRTKRSVQKRKARNTQKAETKVL